jgi:phosphomannomutase
MAELEAASAGLTVGYEANGGFLLGGTARGKAGTLAPLVTRDAMLPMLCVLAMAAEAGTPLSALATDLPPRFTASDRLTDFDPARSQPLLARLAAEAEARDALLVGISARVTGVDLTDGVRMHLAAGEIAHLRASGNAPELRCYAEAADPVRAREIVSTLLAKVARTA